MPTPSRTQRSLGGNRRNQNSKCISRCMHSPRSCGETLECSPASGEVVPQEPAQRCQHRPVSPWWARWCDVGLPVVSWMYPVTTVLRVEKVRIHDRCGHHSEPRPTISIDLRHLKLKESGGSTDTEGTRCGHHVPHCERRGVGALADHLRRGAFAKKKKLIWARAYRQLSQMNTLHVQIWFLTQCADEKTCHLET